MEPNQQMIVKRTVLLSDGSEWNGVAYTTRDLYDLWIELDEGYSMPEVFFSFNDPEKTATIVSKVEISVSLTKVENTFIDYTTMTDIKMAGKRILIRMRKQSVQEMKSEESNDDRPTLYKHAL